MVVMKHNESVTAIHDTMLSMRLAGQKPTVRTVFQRLQEVGRGNESSDSDDGSTRIVEPVFHYSMTTLFRSRHALGNVGTLRSNNVLHT